MVDCEFSEFSYGYSALRELEGRLGRHLARAPEQPSLLTEGTVGYDAALYTVTHSYLVQFKRPYHVGRRHPQGDCDFDGTHEDTCTWLHLRRPHWRTDIDTGSRQFAAMRSYEDEITLGSRCGMSVYLFPDFHREQDLDRHFFARGVLARSTLLRPSALPADGAVHRVCVTHGRSRYVFSEMAVLKSVSVEDLLDVERPSVDTSTLDLATLASRLADTVLGPDVVPTDDLSALELARTCARRLGGELLVFGHRVRRPDRGR